MEKHCTFSLDEYARRNINYLENMVDLNNQPYFNVFWTNPISAVHDWPDICDVAIRQLQAAVFIKHMTGMTLGNEDRYRENLFRHLSPKDGLLYRPKTDYTIYSADIDEQSLCLYTLVTLMQDEISNKIEDMIKKLIGTLLNIGIKKEKYLWFRGFRYFPDGWRDQNFDGPGKGHYMMMIRPLLQFYRLTNFNPAFDLAEKIINGILSKSNYLNKSGSFDGHVHAHLGFLSGLADYAFLVGDDKLISLVISSYNFIKSKSTEFGWIPEETGRKSDCIGSETCAIMDYIQLAILLAKHGNTKIWEDIEKIARNHLVESQFLDTEWMKDNNELKDNDEITYYNIHERMKGGFAGWSSPNHYLAYLEYLPDGWRQGMSKTVMNKYRIAQNCCGGSGTRALFNIWKNIAEVKDRTLIVNLHFDKKLKQAEIRCFKPFKGITSLILMEDLKLKIRVPDFLHKNDIFLVINGVQKDFWIETSYLNTDFIAKGSKIEMFYPLPVKETIFSIGNDGYQQYVYESRWKGDTVIDISAHENIEEGYSHVNKGRVRIFSRNEGPGNLYQRKYLLENDIVPDLSLIITDTGKIYF